MSAISYPQVVQKLFTNPHEGKKLAEFLMTNRNTRENDVQKALNTNYADRIAYNSRVTLNGSDDVTKGTCLLYTSPSPRDRQKSRMPSSA